MDRIRERLRAGREKGSFAAGVMLVLALDFMLFIFAPLEIYLNNQSDFWYDFFFILPWCLMFFAIAFVCSLIVMAILWLLGDVVYDLGLVFFLTLIAGCYYQGNFQVGNLPALDGTPLDLSKYRHDVIVSCVVWVILAVAVWVLYLKCKRSMFRRVIRIGATYVFLILLVTTVTLFFTSAGYVKKDYLTCIKDNQFEMSDDRNFVIFVLDAVDADKYEEIYATHPEYEDMLQDFTYFANTLSGYPCTDCAMPLIMSGEWYENKEPFEEYLHHVYSEGRLFDVLEQAGYEMSLYDSELSLLETRIGNRYKNLIHSNLTVSDPVIFVKRQIKMIGYKYAPWILKDHFWFNAQQLWNQRKVNTDNDLFMWDDWLFYLDVQQVPVTYTDAKQFKMIHLEGAHVPFRYDENMNVVYNTDYESSVAASMTLLGAYLDKLREADVYDNTVILVMSDHGFCEEVKVGDGRQHPILFIKGIGEKHGLQVSQAPISQVDYVDAYEKLLTGVPSSEAFPWKEGDSRERRYLYYHIRSMKHMVEYLQRDHASRSDLLQPTGMIYDY